MKYLGIINNFKNNAKKEATNQMKKQAKRAMKKAALKALSSTVTVAMPVLVPAIIAATIGCIVYGLIDLGVELFTSENNPKLVYETLGIEDVSDLIEIKGNEQDGYYLDFVDGIDEKLKEIVEGYNKSAEYHAMPKDINFIKKMLKAEVITQFPDLKGNIPSDSEDGFQGTVTIRRVTPNKELRRNEKYWKR